MGIEDGKVSTSSPSISGKEYGIYNMGSCRFYDGIIRGAVGMRGDFTDKQVGVGVHRSTENGVETIILSNTSTTANTFYQKMITTIPQNEQSENTQPADAQMNSQTDESDIGIEENTQPQEMDKNTQESTTVSEDKEDKEDNKDTQEKTETSDENEINEESANNSETESNIPQEQIPQVAQIGEKTYDTLALAIQEANDSGEILLLENIESNEEILVDKGKNIKLNLNGKNITSSAMNTINNNGILTITGSGIIKNEAVNGIVINNTGTLNMENGIITTEKNGGKGIYNAGEFYMKNGKIVTQGVEAIGVYNEQNAKVTIENGIIEITGNGSKCIYNNSELEFTKGKLIVSGDDGMGVYNSKTAKTCNIKSAEITITAKNINNYELIKDTNEFKQELNKMKSSYGIYNDSDKPVEVERATIKAERLKSVGIKNAGNGTINFGKNDGTLENALPIVYAVSDNTKAIEKSGKGVINFYDGRMVTKTSVKDILTTILEKYEIVENIGDNVINTILKLIK